MKTQLNDEQINFFQECILMNIPESHGGFRLQLICRRILREDSYKKGDGAEMEKINRVISWYRIKKKHNINE